jgi:hypothetical protein
MKTSKGQAAKRKKVMAAPTDKPQNQDPYTPVYPYGQRANRPVGDKPPVKGGIEPFNTPDKMKWPAPPMHADTGQPTRKIGTPQGGSPPKG